MSQKFPALSWERDSMYGKIGTSRAAGNERKALGGPRWNKPREETRILTQICLLTSEVLCSEKNGHALLQMGGTQMGGHFSSVRSARRTCDTIGP